MKNFLHFIFRHRYDIFYSCILILIFAFVFYMFPKDETKTIIKHLENKTFDIRQSIISKNKKVNKDIIIVTVDNPSYEYLTEKYGDWPIPRNVYADIINYIEAQNPKYIVFDLLFIKTLNRIPKSDVKLINAFKNYNNIYTAVSFDDYPKEMRVPPIIDKKLSSNILNIPSNIEPEKFINARLILPEIIQATSNIGHINTIKDDDGFIRKIPAFIEYSDNCYLYLTFKLGIDYLNKYENQNISKLQVDKNNNLILGKRKIPLNNNAQVILNWYGKSGITNDNSFKYISFWEILKEMENQETNDIFKDKIVYIGTSVSSLSDIKTVPTEKYMPGVEVHATLLNNIIDNSLIKQAPLSTNIIITIILSLIFITTVFFIRSVAANVIIYLLTNIIYLYLSAYIMSKHNLWIWIIIPIFISGLVFVSSFIIKYLIKSRDFEYTYKLATTDGLTELYNHRYFQEQLRFKIKQAEKLKNSFSVIIIDIDFFKKFNDTYGHQAGDAVLKNVAKTLKSCVRSEDYVCRYGGEEMTIILNNTSHESAVNIAQKVCNTIASKKFELTPELEVNVTISLGVATYPDNGNTPSEIIEYADKCLYNAKETGRNKVGSLN